MSVFVSLSLDCNGCTARFVPTTPISLAPALRKAAAAAGWRTPGAGSRAWEDHCPVCADGIPARPKLPRGICRHCRAEHVVRTDGTMVYHSQKERDRYGRPIPCDGSGKAHLRMTSPGRPVDHDWRDGAHRA